jgi:NUMOD4 motif-containing protein
VPMETWLDIPGYEGFYQVSSLGKVRSLIRLTPDAIQAGKRRVKKVLRFGVNEKGRRQVVLSREGATRRFLVHRLVLTAFVRPPMDGEEGWHIDKDYINNAVANLEWRPPRRKTLSD